MNYFSRPVKSPYFKVRLFFYLALLLGDAQPAGASLISASAAIDWSTFKVTPIDTGQGLPTLIWDTQEDYSHAETSSICCSGNSDSASNWSRGTLATDSGPISIASASTSVSQLKADASINGFPNQFLFSTSDSNRSGGFTVQGNGILLVQANYSMALEGSTTPGATAGTTVSFTLDSSSTEGIFGHASQIIDFGYSMDTGILSTALLFQDGWNGSFSACSYAFVTGEGVNPNPVPLPAAFWLFGSALAGVAALRRSHSVGYKQDTVIRG